MTELSQRFELHTTQIKTWKSRAIKLIESGFDDKSRKRKENNEETLVNDLYRQIGQLSYELSWVKKKVGPTS